MSNIRIPPEHKKVFFVIAKLSDSAITELCSILESVPTAIQYQDAVMEALSNTTQIPSKDACAIGTVLFSLYAVLERSDKSINIFVDELIDSLYQVKDVGTDAPSAAEKKLLSDKLTKLLNVSSIRIITKATRVVFDCDNILTQARVLTDIRPIFGYGDDDLILGSVIVQTLKLEYVKDDKKKEFFVNLDDEDVDNLIAILQRAKRKTDRSKELLEVANVTYIPMVQE